MSVKRAVTVCAAVIAASIGVAHACENNYAKLDAEFEGARMSSCEAKKNSFTIRIDPEDKPINPSPWYAFRVTPKQPGEVKITMRYSHSKHRYRPKRSDDGARWSLIEPKKIRERRGGRKVVMRVAVDDTPVLVAAQEFLNTGAYEKWTADIAERASLETSVIGESVEGRPLVAVSSQPKTKADRKEHVLFVGRQHPPELTGAFAMLAFLETVFADTPLAEQFRNRFFITAVPLMNPDGVVHGHWRHNMNGVDLNRDWGPFTQPETQAVKAILDDVAGADNSELRLMLDFHSTNRNVFYTQFKNVDTIPPQFTQEWIASASERLDAYEFEYAERETTDLATSKNYVHRRFGAPAITYELGDQTDRRLIRASAVVFAEEMMETLLASDPALEDNARVAGQK